MRDAFQSELACFERAYFLFNQQDKDGLEELDKQIDQLKTSLCLTNRAHIALKNLVAELIDILEVSKNATNREPNAARVDEALPRESGETTSTVPNESHGIAD